MLRRKWNRAKDKITFLRKDGIALYIAGFYSWFQDKPCFVILTTRANSSMKSTHSRMPLILEPDQVREWLENNEKTKDILNQESCMLKKEAEYEQQCLPFF